MAAWTSEGSGEVGVTTPVERRTEGSLAGVELTGMGTVEVARTLAERVAELGRAEVELARSEVQTEVKRRGLLAGGFAGITGLCFLSSLCCALVAAILAIGTALSPIWVAVVGACLFALLGVLAGYTVASEVRELKPERTLRQARATAALLRHPARESR